MMRSWSGGLALLAATATLTAIATAAFGAGPGTYALVNGRIYTENARQPWAKALVVEGERIAYVGDADTPEWKRLVTPGTPVHDLKSRLVIPGFVDAHTHPGLTAMIGTGDPERDEAEMMPAPVGRAATLRWLRHYAKEHPHEERIVLGAWDVASFLPKGPHRRDLDAIWPTTPVLLMDNSGHSTWANSAMLKQLGVDAKTPDLSPGISVFVRDGNGVPTGWIKEFAAMHAVAPLLMPPPAEFKARLARHLDYLASHGVTTLFDGGNLGLEDQVYGELAALDRAGRLPVRYFGSYHIWDPAQIDGAVAGVRRLQAAYGGPHLRFDTVKIHYDGVTEVLTAALLKPYATDPGNRGGLLYDSHRLARLIVELDAEKLNLHLHVVGDRATHEALDAVAEARRTLGRAPSIEITLCHLELVDPADVARFRELNIHANFTPHWFGGTQFGRAGALVLGRERAERDQLAGTFWRAGANVTLSSDVTSSDEIPRTNPFFGLEMAMTRVDVAGGRDPDRRHRPEERLDLSQALAAYTINGSRALGIAPETGSIEAGKKADFVVVSRDPFRVTPRHVHEAVAEATVLDGRVTAGALP
jgi:predicted amidohydrolase YtcJ